MSRPVSPSHKTKNWPADDDALKQRGPLTLRFDPDMAWGQPPAFDPCRPPHHGDAAAQTCLKTRNWPPAYNEVLKRRGMSRSMWNSVE